MRLFRAVSWPRHFYFYRLGMPLKRLAQIIKNPRSIKAVLSRIKQQLARLKRQVKSPKVYYYQRLRNSQREKL